MNHPVNPLAQDYSNTFPGIFDRSDHRSGFPAVLSVHQAEILSAGILVLQADVLEDLWLGRTAREAFERESGTHGVCSRGVRGRGRGRGGRRAVPWFSSCGIRAIGG